MCACACVHWERIGEEITLFTPLLALIVVGDKGSFCNPVCGGNVCEQAAETQRLE